MKNDKKSFIRLGTFTQDRNGNLDGKIFGLGLGVVPVVFEPMEAKDHSKYLRGIANPTTDAYEIGAAFPREDKNHSAYYSVSLDSALFPAPVNAALFPDRNNPKVFNLVWSRPDADQSPNAQATVNINVPPESRTQEQTHTPVTPT
jgi:uncharacterized protein (DUF736 family)